jgi:hypothetical protein
VGVVEVGEGVGVSRIGEVAVVTRSGGVVVGVLATAAVVVDVDVDVDGGRLDVVGELMRRSVSAREALVVGTMCEDFRVV